MRALIKILIFLIVSCQKIEEPSQEFDKFFGIKTLLSNRYFYIKGYLNEGDTIYAGFYTSSSNGIKFFIVDKENYDKWQNGESVNYLIIYENINEIDVKFPVFQRKEYYVVIQNGQNPQKFFIRIKKL
ncbi:MAG: hypothetical protein N2504_03650 [candidate division WOR-3 bacterium]|nr:hypothetical protein [candidate division WOR-3 bacterium]